MNEIINSISTKRSILNVIKEIIETLEEMKKRIECALQSENPPSRFFCFLKGKDDIEIIDNKIKQLQKSTVSHKEICEAVDMINFFSIRGGA